MILLTLGGPLVAGETWISADLGVKIFGQDRSRVARLENAARPGEQIAFYARPHADGVFYIIENDGEKARPVHRVAGKKNENRILPPGKQGLKPGQWEYRILFCPRGLPRVEQMFRNGQVPAADWARLVADLERESRIELGDTTAKPDSLAANVRGLDDGDSPGADDPFFRALRTYSGRGLLLRTYRFSVR